MNTPSFSDAAGSADPASDILEGFAAVIDPDNPTSEEAVTKAREFYRKTYPLFFTQVTRELISLVEQTRPRNIREVADYVGKSTRTVEKWIKAGLPSSNVLGSIFVTIPDVDSWIRLHRRSCFTAAVVATKSPTTPPTRRRRRPRKSD